MCRKCSGHINVILKDQENLFDLIDQLPDENSKRVFLLKLRQSIEEQNSQRKVEQSPIIYSYQDVSNRIKGEAKKPFQIEDFHFGVKILKREVADSKQQLTALEQAFNTIQEAQSSNAVSIVQKEIALDTPANSRKVILIEETEVSGSINYISKVQNQKWMSKIIFR